jgi:hypothetical protein
MNLIDIRHRDAFDIAVEEIHRDAIIVQLPAVFVLLAAPSLQGAAQLDRSKIRLYGKNYGSAIGSLARFLEQADPSQMPAEFSTLPQFERMAGSFIRLRFRSADFQSPTIRNGTHQGLLLDGLHRDLFKRLESSFAALPPDEAWGGINYGAPLCTSCNVSGDADGSIVDAERALAFARDRGVRLVITCPGCAPELGSYPILGYERHRVTVHREGPGLDRFKAQIPPHLRSW